jgi:hypothetical protein
MKIRRWAGVAAAGLILALVPVVPADANVPAQAGPAARAAVTQVNITNRYPHQVQAFVGYDSSDCANWMVRGWFVIDSGDTRHVANTSGSSVLFWAESNGDDAVWDGSALTVNIPNERFGTCDTYLQQALPGTRRLGMRMRTFSAGTPTYTIILTP